MAGGEAAMLGYEMQAQQEDVGATKWKWLWPEARMSDDWEATTLITENSDLFPSPRNNFMTVILMK